MVTIETLQASFSRHLKAESTADRTITLHNQSIRQFRLWLVDNDLPEVIGSLTRHNIREWLATLAETKSDGTLRIRHLGLSRFCRWLLEEGEIDEHPMKGLALPPIQQTLVEVIPDEDLVALLKACNGKTFNDRRDEVILRLLLDCGLRVSELTRLSKDIDLDAGSAVVVGKGQKIRVVYFGARTTRALDRYLRLRAGHRWAHLDTLILTQRGGISPDGVRERLNVLADRAGVDRAKIHPHAFRHTWAHDYLDKGGGERNLKRLAGWSSDTMLERYGASLADARARAEVERMRRGDRV